MTSKVGSGIREGGLVGGPLCKLRGLVLGTFPCPEPASPCASGPDGDLLLPPGAPAPGPPAPGAPQPLLAWLLLPLLLFLFLAAYFFR